MKFATAARQAAFCIALFSCAACPAFGQYSAAKDLLSGIDYTRPNGVLHQYPLNGSRENPPSTDIGIRAIGAYAAALLSKQSFVAIGSRSGIHVLTAHLSRNRTVAIFHATAPFDYNETVRFPMSATLLGGQRITDTVHFTTMVRATPPGIPDFILNEAAPNETGEKSGIVKNGAAKSAIKGMVQPLDNDSFPPMIVTVDDSATAGTIYFDNFGYIPVQNACYNFTADKHGTITRYEELPGESSRDFKPQPNGMITYYDIDAGAYIGVDSNWNPVDTFAAVGMGTDMHELIVFPDTSYALLGLTSSFVDMSAYGGFDSSLVYSDVIQIFDRDANLIFQWRGIDHYNVGDSKYEDLTAPEIDFEHANSLDFDSSGNILLSNRHLCEISQINGVTGDFIWRFGGAHNQFTIVGDTLVFSFQHDARWLPNGDMTIFDNSNYDTIIGGNGAWIQKSRGVEYALDTAAKIASLAWQYYHTPQTWSSAMGSVERLSNGNTFIGWGQNDSLAMTELRFDNSTAFEMQMLDGNASYRAVKMTSDSSFGIIGILDTSSESVSATVNVVNSFTLSSLANGAVAAQFMMAASGPVSLAIYDMAGRVVQSVLSSQWESSGEHQIALDMSGLPSGAYECAYSSPGLSEAHPFYNLK